MMVRTAKFRLLIVLYAVTGALVIAAISLGAVGLRFTSYRNGYCNISLSNNQAEVMYRLGTPTYVYGPSVKMLGGYASHIYSVDPSEDPKNAMPDGKSATDFDQWSYTGISSIGPSGRLDVSFQKSNGQAQRISCLGASAKSCPSLAGISIGTTEEALRGFLGEPDTQKLEGVAKIVVYKKLGLEFYLTEDKVYNIALLRPTRSKWYAALVRVKSLLGF